MKKNVSHSIIALFTLVSLVLAAPVHATQRGNTCTKILWFTICHLSVPNKPLHPIRFPHPTKKPHPSPTRKPTISPTITPSPTSAPTATPIPTPLLIGAKLTDYAQPIGLACDIDVPSEFSTIQEGVNASEPGDTVCVDAGTYNEDVIVNKSIILSGDGATNTSVINGQAPGYGGTMRIDADNVTIEGFVINGVGVGYQNGSLQIAESHSGAIVRYNRIVSGNEGLALLTDGFQNNHLFQHNIFEGNDSQQIALINGTPSTGKASADIEFLNNTFIGTVKQTERQDTGIILASQATNTLIKRNVFNNTGTIIELIQNSYPSNIINQNNFNAVTTVKVRGGSGGTTNAESNWWGDSNPSDNIQGDVDFTPFVLGPYAEN